MPRTKLQGVVFGILMSITMAIGMGVYNDAVKMGYNAMPGGMSNMTGTVIIQAFMEASYMWLFVFLFSNLWGNRIGHMIADKIICPEKDSQFFMILIRSSCTVLIMCPTMSMVATILFNIILGGASLWRLPTIWTGTVMKNFPMALLWNLFAAGPVTRWMFRILFADKTQAENAVSKEAF